MSLRGAERRSNDETLAQRVRKILENHSNVSEKKMFGGLSFMLNGNMCCGIVNNQLMVRVGPENYASALLQPYAREMDFTGKSLKGFVYVSAEGIRTDDDLKAWVERAVDFVSSLPEKKNHGSTRNPSRRR